MNDILETIKEVINIGGASAAIITLLLSIYDRSKNVKVNILSDLTSNQEKYEVNIINKGVRPLLINDYGFKIGRKIFSEKYPNSNVNIPPKDNYRISMNRKGIVSFLNTPQTKNLKNNAHVSFYIKLDERLFKKRLNCRYCDIQERYKKDWSDN